MLLFSVAAALPPFDEVTVDGITALPAGTVVAGTVTDLERAGKVKGLGRGAAVSVRLSDAITIRVPRG